MTISPIKRFWRLLAPYKFELRQIHVYAIFVGLVNLTLPLGLQAIINYLQTGEITSSWIILVTFVLSGIAITGVLQIMQLRIVENIQQDIFAKAAFEFAYRIPKISFYHLDKGHAPELVNRFFDVVTIQKGLPKILIDFSLAVFQIAFGLILLSIYSSYFILLGIALIILLWIMFKVVGPKGLSTSIKESKNKYKLVHWLEEVAQVISSFKIYANNNLHLTKTDKITADYVVTRENHFQIQLFQFRLFIGFKVFLKASLLILGGYLVIQGQMNIGQFIAAEIIILLIINSIEKVMRTIDTIYDVLTALDKIGYVTDFSLDANPGNTILSKGQALSIRGVEIQFGFPNQPNKLLKKLSFDIQKKAKVLLDGSAGSGKSSLLKIIIGLYQIEEGELYINDIPILNYDKHTLFDKLGVFLPDNQVFEGSYRDNICMGRDISNLELEKTLGVLNLDNYFIHQPNGIDCPVDSGGKSVPRSILQKILLARIMVNNPMLLVLEDPLSHTDKDEQKKIIDFIMDNQRNWTVIVISNNPYWRLKCTQIINL